MPKKKSKKKRSTRKSRIRNILLFSSIILGCLAVILIFLPNIHEPRRIVEGPSGTEAPPVKTKAPERTMGPVKTEVPPVKTKSPERTREPVKTKAPVKTKRPVTVKTSVPSSGIKERPYKMAIVIDDAGNSVSKLKVFLDSSARLTYAIIPGLRFSLEAGQMIQSSGREAILHMPMEPLGNANPGEGALLVELGREELIGRLTKGLDAFPFVGGINNHMGSKATSSEYVMNIVMGVLKERGKFFLDSRTTAESVARKAAAQTGIPFLERHVFLDYTVTRENVEKQLKEGIEIAQKRGSSIVIGHVQHLVVIETINDFLPVFKKENIELVYLSELL